MIKDLHIVTGLSRPTIEQEFLELVRQCSNATVYRIFPEIRYEYPVRPREFEALQLLIHGEIRGAIQDNMSLYILTYSNEVYQLFRRIAAVEGVPELHFHYIDSDTHIDIHADIPVPSKKYIWKHMSHVINDLLTKSPQLHVESNYIKSTARLRIFDADGNDVTETDNFYVGTDGSVYSSIHDHENGMHMLQGYSFRVV